MFRTCFCCAGGKKTCILLLNGSKKCSEISGRRERKGAALHVLRGSWQNFATKLIHQHLQDMPFLVCRLKPALHSGGMTTVIIQQLFSTTGACDAASLGFDKKTRKEESAYLDFILIFLSSTLRLWVFQLIQPPCPRHSTRPTWYWKVAFSRTQKQHLGCVQVYLETELTCTHSTLLPPSVICSTRPFLPPHLPPLWRCVLSINLRFSYDHI